MSSGNPTVDRQIEAASALLEQQWRNSPRVVQPENDLKPDTSALQFRIKILEDKYSALETALNQLARHVRR